MEKKQAMEDALAEIKSYFNEWLKQSNLTEEDFFAFRTCKKYKLSIKECIQNDKEGIGVFITHGDGLAIGLPFWVGYDNSDMEKEQFFYNTALILTYMAGQLDRMNQKEPIPGSFNNGYFMLKTKNFLPQFLEHKKRLLSA